MATNKRKILLELVQENSEKSQRTLRSNGRKECTCKVGLIYWFVIFGFYLLIFYYIFLKGFLAGKVFSIKLEEVLL